MLITVSDLTMVVCQASFDVHELTEHGVRVVFLFCFVLFFSGGTNKLGYLLMKSSYGDCF